MVEWSITPVLKTGVLRGTGGSNPSLSAHKRKYKSSANKIYTFSFFIKTDDKKSHHRRFGDHSAFD